MLVLAAVLLSSQAALAARVAVSPLEGDPKGKLRAQVSAALRKARKVELAPPTAWAQAAGRPARKGAAAVTPEDVKRLAPRLRVEAVLTGSVARDFEARLVDRDGQVVWSERYPLKRGLLSPKDAARLAQAVAAPRTAPPPPPVAVATPPPAPPVSARPLEAPRELPPEPAPKPAPPAPVVKQEPPARAPEKAKSPAPRTDARPAALAWVELEDESHTFVAGSGGGVADEEPLAAPRVLAPHPPWVRLWAGAAVTWRTYCARPGVASCAEFDARPPEQRLGDSSDFRSNAPYLGLAADAEVFPLAHLPSLLRGLGLTLAYQRGFAPTRVVVTSPTGSTPEREVSASDTAYGAMLAWRYVFNRGDARSPLWGYAGARLGLVGRAFDVDETLNVALPVVHRLHPAVGLDVSVPLFPQVRVEAGGRLFLLASPAPALRGGERGPNGAELRDYRTAV
ncbi:MAG: hypothetical protein ABW123_23495 [Cystobacter sp.]